MIIRRNKDVDNFYVYNNRILIKSDGEVEEKLPQIPLSDVCILLSYNAEDVKKDYEDIQSEYDYGIIELMLNASMANLHYYRECEIIPFQSALYYNVYYDSDKLNVSNNQDYLPIQLAGLALFIPEKRMMNLAELEMRVYTDENNDRFITVSDFLDYYEWLLLKNTGRECEVTLKQKEDQLSVLIERKLNE